MTPVLRLVWVACVADLAAGMRRKSQRASGNQSSVDCEAFNELTIKGKQVGKAATVVCNSWPQKWGEFPIGGIERAKEIFDYGFAAGGLWDQMKNLADERSRSPDFCWRDHDSPDKNFCFEDDTYYGKGFLRKTDMPGQKRTKEPTQLWCQKRCALVSGCKHFSYYSMDGGCHLQNGDATPHDYIGRRPVAGPPVCSETQLAQSISQLNASDSGEDEWFGSGGPTTGCPDGFQPTTLLGKFAPVCSSRCQGSALPFGCGFGCASSARTCVSRIMDQVTKVVNTVGQVAGFLTGNQVIAQVVEKILMLVEFIVSTFGMLVRLGKELWSAYRESESVAGFISVFVSFIRDNAEQVGQNMETLTALFGDVISFWLDMIDEGFKFPEINLNFVTDTMNKYGEATLDGAMGLVSVFVFPKCEVE